MAADPDINELLRKIGEDLKIINAPRAEPIQVSLDYEPYVKAWYCKTCAKKSINKYACYNIIGSVRGAYCFAHMKPGMVDVKNKTCKYDGCYIRPSFNYPNQKRGIYCVTHKQIGMKDVENDTCVFLNCQTQPIFNYSNEIKGIYCANHRLDGMINVVDKTCLIGKCIKQAVFNYIGELKGIYCFNHRLENMFDIRTKLCYIKNCKSRPFYGFPLQKRTHCFTHREEGMLRYPKQKCIISGCEEYSFYGVNYPLHCETHKLPDELNMVEKKCSSCGLIMVLNQNNLCQYCGDFIHKRVHLVKQTAVKNFLDANELKYDSYDKVYDRECGLERPDFVFDRKEFVIIVEVDENQHRSYLEECECSRMVNIYNSFGGARVMFIRYNPDKYTGEQYTDNQRLDILKTCLINMAWNPSPLPLTFVKLFFDGFEVAKTNITEIPVI